MRVLFLGDIVGKPGKQAVLELLPGLVRHHRADVVVANCENVAGGAGVNPEAAEELLAGGCDLLTSGNHIWTRAKEITEYISTSRRLLRPANYPKPCPGRGHAVVPLSGGRKLGVVNLEGRVFMKPLDDPFPLARQLVNELKRETPAVLVDFHGEATSEKNAMGAYLDGLASAVIGTHTHVQTADERILPGGTAYLTDAGMCGPLDSVIGLRKEMSVARFLTQRRAGFEIATGLVYVQGAVVEIDDATGRAVSIERVRAKHTD
jgi:metallophosphoesterase (TIGR00282 family)